MKTIAVPVDEYRLFHEIYLESLKVRDRGIREFNRLPPAMRLAVVSLALLYKERGYSDRGTPKGGS